MKTNLFFSVVVLSLTAAISPASQYDCQWYNDSWIHTHISINPNVSDMPFFIRQVETVRPDAIQFHTHDISLMKKCMELKLPEQLNYKPVATINQAGVWYPHYDESDKYVYRINPDGTFAGRWSRKHLCLNSPAVDEIVIPKYYTELVRELKPAQVWIDESMITINLCYCPNCKRLFKEQYGFEPPVKLTDDNFKQWRQWVQFHIDGFEEWMKKVVDAAHSVDPNILVTFNAAYSLAQPEAPPEFIKNLSHDVHSYPLETGMYSRYFGSIDIPFDIMPGLGDDAWAGIEPKPLEKVLAAIALIIPHGGIWNIGEFPTSFTNLIDAKQYTDVGYRPADEYLKLAEEGTKFTRDRQAYCQHSKSVRNVALLQSASTHYAHVIFNMAAQQSDTTFGITSDGTRVENLKGVNSRIFWPNNNPVATVIIGAYEALLENHIHFDMIHEQHLQKHLDDYKLLILSEQAYLEDATKEKIRSYVRKGGRVIATGASLLAGFADVFGVELLSKTPESDVKIDYDGAQVNARKFWKVKTKGAKILCGSDLNNTPGITIHDFGKGRAMYIAGDIFKDYFDRSGHSYTAKGDNAAIRRFANTLFEKMLTGPKINIEAPPCFEFVHRTKEGNTYFHFINRKLDWKQKQEDAVDSILVQMPLVNEPKSLLLQPGGQPIDYIHADGELVFSLDPEAITYHRVVELKPKSK